MKYKKTLIDALQHILLFNISSIFLPQSQNFNTFLNEPVDHEELIQNEYVYDIKPKNIISFIEDESSVISGISTHDPSVQATPDIVFNKKTVLKNIKKSLNILPVNIENYSTDKSINEVLVSPIIRKKESLETKYSSESKVSDIQPLEFSNESKVSDIQPLEFSNESKVSDIQPLEFSNESKVSDIPDTKYSSESKVSDIQPLEFSNESKVSDIPDTKYSNESKVSDIKPLEFSNESKVSDIPDIKYSSESKVSDIQPLEFSNESNIIIPEFRSFPEKNITENSINDIYENNIKNSTESLRYIPFSRKFKNGFFNPNIIDKSRIKRFLFREYSGDSKIQNIINEKLENIPAFAQGGSISADSIDYSTIATNEPGSSKNERISISPNTDVPTSISRINNNIDKSGSNSEESAQDLEEIVNIIQKLNSNINQLSENMKAKKDNSSSKEFFSNIVRSAYNSISMYRR